MAFCQTEPSAMEMYHRSRHYRTGLKSRGHCEVKLVIIDHQRPNVPTTMSTSRLALSVLTRVPKCMRYATDIYMRSGTVVTPVSRLTSGSSLHRTRPFASSSIARAAPPAPTEVPKATASISSAPNPDELQAQELDVDVIPPEDLKLELTDRAAEVCPVFVVDSIALLLKLSKQLKSIATRERHPDAGLRIAVESGGCHGYQYTMKLASERNPED